VKHHHQKVEERNGSEFSQDIIVDIVRLSDVICKQEQVGYTGDSIEVEVTEDLWERLPIDGKYVEKLVSISGEEIEKAAILVDLT
jgi:hypothetical protein